MTRDRCRRQSFWTVRGLKAGRAMLRALGAVCLALMSCMFLIGQDSQESSIRGAATKALRALVIRRLKVDPLPEAKWTVGRVRTVGLLPGIVEGTEEIPIMVVAGVWITADGERFRPMGLSGSLSLAASIDEFDERVVVPAGADEHYVPLSSKARRALRGILAGSIEYDGDALGELCWVEANRWLRDLSLPWVDGREALAGLEEVLRVSELLRVGGRPELAKVKLQVNSLASFQDAVDEGGPGARLAFALWDIADYDQVESVVSAMDSLSGLELACLLAFWDSQVPCRMRAFGPIGYRRGYFGQQTLGEMVQWAASRMLGRSDVTMESFRAYLLEDRL